MVKLSDVLKKVTPAGTGTDIRMKVLLENIKSDIRAKSKAKKQAKAETEKSLRTEIIKTAPYLGVATIPSRVKASQESLKQKEKSISDTFKATVKNRLIETLKSAQPTTMLSMKQAGAYARGEDKLGDVYGQTIYTTVFQPQQTITETRERIHESIITIPSGGSAFTIPDFGLKLPSVDWKLVGLALVGLGGLYFLSRGNK